MERFPKVYFPKFWNNLCLEAKNSSSIIFFINKLKNETLKEYIYIVFLYKVKLLFMLCVKVKNFLVSLLRPYLSWRSEIPVSEVRRSNVTFYTFFKSSRALSKESAKIFAHLQKLEAYIAKKCSKFFFFFKIWLVIHFLQALAIQNMQNYLQNIKHLYTDSNGISVKMILSNRPLYSSIINCIVL